jgi:hypothetical protein
MFFRMPSTNEAERFVERAWFFELAIKSPTEWSADRLDARLQYEKRADMHKALLSLACALICWNFLQGHFP